MTLLVIVFMLQLSLVILSISSPISLAILLIISAVSCSVVVGIMFSSWVFYFLTLVFLGGVMVVLMFMTSVCTNTKLALFNPKALLIAPLALGLLVTPTNMALNNYSNLNFCLSIYSFEGLLILVLLILSLLLCMVSVVSVVKLEYGPLIFRL